MGRSISLPGPCFLCGRSGNCCPDSGRGQNHSYQLLAEAIMADFYLTSLWKRTRPRWKPCAAFAVAFVPRGITLNSVCPGIADDSIVNRLPAEAKQAMFSWLRSGWGPTCRPALRRHRWSRGSAVQRRCRLDHRPDDCRRWWSIPDEPGSSFGVSAPLIAIPRISRFPSGWAVCQGLSGTRCRANHGQNSRSRRDRADRFRHR